MGIPQINRAAMKVLVTSGDNLQVSDALAGFQALSASNVATGDLLRATLLQQDSAGSVIGWEVYDGSSLITVSGTAGAPTLTRPSSPSDSSAAGAKITLGGGEHTLFVGVGAESLEAMAAIVNPIVLTMANSATPDVEGYSRVKTGGTTTITNFLNTAGGQFLWVEGGTGGATIANNANIVTLSGSSLSLAEGDIAGFVEIDGALHEVTPNSLFLNGKFKEALIPDFTSERLFGGDGFEKIGVERSSTPPSGSRRWTMGIETDGDLSFQQRADDGTYRGFSDNKLRLFQEGGFRFVAADGDVTINGDVNGDQTQAFVLVNMDNSSTGNRAEYRMGFDGTTASTVYGEKGGGLVFRTHNAEPIKFLYNSASVGEITDTGLTLNGSSGATAEDMGVTLLGRRRGTSYGNAFLSLGAPRSDTGDGFGQSGRGALTLLGNSSNTASSLWISSAASGLDPASYSSDSDLEALPAGLKLNSSGVFQFWNSNTKVFDISSGYAQFGGFASTAGAIIFALRPTNYAANVPQFFISKDSVTDRYDIGLWDGSDYGGRLTHRSETYFAENVVSANNRGFWFTSSGGLNNCRLYRAGGDAMRFEYQDSKFIFDALGDDAFELHNSNDQTVLAIVPGATPSSTVTTLSGDLNISSDASAASFEASGSHVSSGLVEAGRGNGSVALTTNDGGGNASVCFNHRALVPDNASATQSAGRISCNVDSGTAAMKFQLANNTTTGVSTVLVSQMEIETGSVRIIPRLRLDGGLKFGSTGIEISTVLDEDDMASNSATALPTQQSTKAYVDNTAAKAGAKTDNWFWVRRNSADVAARFTNQSTGSIAEFRAGSGDGTVRATITNGGDITASGDITAYSSDERLKGDIKTIREPLAKVRQLRGVTYRWNDLADEVGVPHDGNTEHGVIAQEVAKVVPDAVVPAPVDPEYFTVKHNRLIPVLIEAVKALEEQNRILAERLTSLEEEAAR